MPTRRAESMHRSAVRHRGFTLIEVLVALVIVAVSMTAAILVVTQRTRDGTYLRDKTLAHWIAMNLLTERRLQADAPALGKSSDGLEYAGVQWRWTVEVKETAVDSMRRLDVSVRQADAPEDSSLATVTGFYGTAVAGAVGSPTRWESGGTDATGGTGNDKDNGSAEGDHNGTQSGDTTGDTTGDGSSDDDNQDNPDAPVVPEPDQPSEDTE